MRNKLKQYAAPHMRGLTVLSILFILAIVRSVNGQDLPVNGQDSNLLKQIENIEVDLTSLDESTEENLYMSDASFTTFYDALSPIGEWIQLTKEEIDEELKDGEGQSFASLSNDDEFVFVWRPSLTDASWKPYANGKWIYTDRGWLWASNDSHGFITHHYGRWFNSPKRGWIWMPGRVWSPAWVKWKLCENYVGWVPVNPNAKWRENNGVELMTDNYKHKETDWSFVGKENLVDENVNTKVVPQNMNKELLGSSGEVSGIRKVTDGVMNDGPDAKDISKRSGKEIMKMRIKNIREKKKHDLTANDVVVFREKFKKADVDVSTGKLKIDKPKKFKKSKRVKIIIKRKKYEGRKPNIRKD